MAEETHESPLAYAYARALLELANEAKSTEELAKELDSMREIAQSVPLFTTVLADPAISQVDRGKLLTTTFHGRISQLLFNFISLLNEKGRLNLLLPISLAFDNLLDDQFGKVEVDVTVAQKLAPDELEAVRLKISSCLKRDAIVHQYIDDSIIGGIIIRVQDRLIDGSVRTQLQNMRRRLHASRNN